MCGEEDFEMYFFRCISMGESLFDGIRQYFGVTQEMLWVDASVDDGTWTRVGRGGAHEWCDADGKLHRDEDTPAVVDPIYGRCWWYQHGQLHRDGDKPSAVSEADGCVEWHKHGQPARAGLEPSHIQLPRPREYVGCRLWFTTGYHAASAPTPWTRKVHYAWR